MSNLFSHAAVDLPEDQTVHAARHAVVVVPVPLAEAFDGFTDGIHLWWPMETHSKFGAEAHVGFENGVLLEDAFTGEHVLWGEVQGWDAPSSLDMRWQMDGHRLSPTVVHVDFATNDDGSTTVSLTHDGWAAGNVGQQQYEKYCDWPLILARYARFMGGVPALD